MIMNGQTVGGLTMYYLCICYVISYCLLACFTCDSKPQWMILDGQTVGGLTMYYVDAFTA